MTRSATGILEQARAAHPEAEFTVIDLKDYDLPMFDGPVAPMVLGGKYDNDAVAAWTYHPLSPSYQ